MLGQTDALPHFWAQDLREAELAWKVWLDRFAASAGATAFNLRPSDGAELPAVGGVRRELLDEVFPGTRVSVVNSDPNADDRPEYEPVATERAGGLRATCRPSSSRGT